MSTDEGNPYGFNPTTPNVARMYDYFLGGKDNFAADREAAEKIIEVAPNVLQKVRENRAFLGRAVHFLAAEAGISQFLDLGAGLPTRDNVHEVAQRVSSGSRVVYVDNDPVVLTHARELLARDSQTTVVQADIRDPAKVLDHPGATELIDLSRPIAVLMVAVLHFVPDDEKPGDIVAAFRERMAPGSHLVISHATPGVMSRSNLTEATNTYSTTSAGSITPRSPEEVERFFGDFELLQPGLVPVAQWRTGTPPAEGIPGSDFVAGVARRT